MIPSAQDLARCSQKTKIVIEIKVSLAINNLHWLEIDARRSKINDIMIYAYLQYYTKYNCIPKTVSRR